jgi:hypothetical protein
VVSSTATHSTPRLAMTGVASSASPNRFNSGQYHRRSRTWPMCGSRGLGDHSADQRREHKQGQHLSAMLRQPPLPLERIRVCKRDGKLLAPPTLLPALADWPSGKS